MDILKLAAQFEKLAAPKKKEDERPDKVWVIVHDIYEPKSAGSHYPVVRHTFIGKTKDEAQGYFDSHMKTDRFFKACEKKGQWEDVKCDVETQSLKVSLDQIDKAYKS